MVNGVLRPLGSLSAPLWNRFVASDPGQVRLLAATRVTLSVGIAGLGLAALVIWGCVPTMGIALGATLTMLAPFLLRDPGRRRRETTLFLMALLAALAYVAGALISPLFPVAEILFLLVIFVAVLLQSRGPRYGAICFGSFLSFYLGIYLHPPAAELPKHLASLPIMWVAVWIVCFVLLPDEPSAMLRRLLRSVLRRTALVLEAAEADALHGTGESRRRLEREFIRLNEAGLVAEEQIANSVAADREVLRRRLVTLELALARVVGAMRGETITPQNLYRVEALRGRFRRGHWPFRVGAVNVKGSSESQLRLALRELNRAGAAVAASHAMVAGPDRQAAPPPAPVGALAWSFAVQATIAAALAMAGGIALSPQRWFWAVITAYVMFLGVRTRGDTAQKILHRVAGTFLGMIAGVVCATLMSGHPVLELAVAVVCIFGSFYMFSVYGISIFFATVMLGLIYGSLGVSTEPLLLLRLEETAIGSGAAILSAFLVLPVRTRVHVHRSGMAVMEALRDVLTAGQQKLSGEAAASPLEKSRLLDRSLRDLRTALRPLNARRDVIRPVDRAERAFPVLLNCAYWARVFAVSCEDEALLGKEDRLLLTSGSRDLEDWVGALIAGLSSQEEQRPAGPYAQANPMTVRAKATGLPAPASAPKTGQPSASAASPADIAAVAALDNLGQALGLLEKRLFGMGRSGFSRLS
ncbi:Uncharacterized membrane protein YccC [Faunimonas pinastri]|uniref:Uncharacterized membrane protein YccC n=1 Tax=Faunimonas pinastri TaxID=1855383 RepID=A0A1H9KDK3_9HYPH|nr:FUSC family protein [Faunimonas pinastri]SEQ97128.1 Uncharacterized membrane protein YccC [Faunimonas pinastri]